MAKNKPVEAVEQEPPAEQPKKQVSEAEAKIRTFAPLVAVVFVAALALWAVGFFIGGGSPEGKCASALLQSGRDSCYYALARDTGNVSYCTLINSTNKRDDCLRIVGSAGTGTSDYCAEMSAGMLRDNCYSALARNGGDPYVCDSVTAGFLRDKCYDDAADAADDAQACMRIQTEAMRYECANGVYARLAIEGRNPLICRNVIYNDAKMKRQIEDSCIMAVAMNISDTSMCGQIANESIRLRCLGITPTVDCSVIADANSKAMCYYDAAMASKNPDDCRLVPGESLQNNCYYQIAVQKQDESICGRITSANMRALCGQAVGGT